MQNEIILTRSNLEHWHEHFDWIYSKAPSTDREGNNRAGTVDNSSHENAIKAIVTLGLHEQLWLNRWTGRYMYGEEQWEDNLRSLIKTRLEYEFSSIGYCPTLAAVENAMKDIASVRGRNPRIEQISDDWDEIDRYHGLALALNQDPTDAITMEIVKLFPRGVVVRALHPGSEFQYCPILYSKQGVGKGQFLKILSAGYHSELITATFNHVNAQQQMMERFRGKSVIEIGEFSGASGRALDTMKTIIGDSEFAGVRAAFGREVKDWPMAGIMAGTTNKEHILTDDENRRHPVLTIEGRIDLDWIRTNIRQIWAQARHEFFDMLFRYNTGQPVDAKTEGILISETGRPRVQIPEIYWEELAERTERHRQPSELEDWLRDEFLVLHDGFLLRGQRLMDASKARFGKVYSQELSNSMRACGWHKQRTTLDGKLVTVWIGPNGGSTTNETISLLP